MCVFCQCHHLINAATSIEYIETIFQIFFYNGEELKEGSKLSFELLYINQSVDGVKPAEMHYTCYLGLLETGSSCI